MSMRRMIYGWIWLACLPAVPMKAQTERPELPRWADILAYSQREQGDMSTVRMLFAGDIMQHEAQLTAARTDSGTYDYTDCFRYVAQGVRSADVAIANLEVPLGVKPYSGYPRFCAPPAFAQAVRDAGFDILTTANNHSLDRYKKGVRRTVDILDSLGVRHTGVFADTASRAERYPLIFEEKGIRFALLNYTYGTNGIPHYPPTFVNVIDTAVIRRDIRAAQKRLPDVIIACMHWGIEYEMTPESSQRDCARFLLENGVDVVIGGHPHVVQPMEAHTDSTGRVKQVLVYSLGNYVSNQRTIDTQGGATFSLSFRRDSTGVHIGDCSYGLVWVWKPVRDGKQSFFPIPVREAERPGSFPLSEAERERMDAFAKNARTFLDRQNINVKENTYEPQ